MTSNVELMMNTEVEMLVYESKCFNSFIRRMLFSKSNNDVSKIIDTIFVHEKPVFVSKLKKCIDIIRSSTKFDQIWTKGHSEVNVSVLTAAWKVAKYCADEDGKLDQLDVHYFHKELNESSFLLENGMFWKWGCVRLQSISLPYDDKIKHYIK